MDLARTLGCEKPEKYERKKYKKRDNIRDRFSAGRGLLKRKLENRDFRPISRFISEMIQDMAIVTTEDE